MATETETTQREHRPDVECWACKGSGRVPLAHSLWSLLGLLSARTRTLRDLRHAGGGRTKSLYGKLRRLVRLGLVTQTERQELSPTGRYVAVGAWRRKGVGDAAARS